jgi:hypothetical protein
MGNPEISKDFTKKIDQIKINLKSWKLPEWILFFVIIPAVLFLVYLIPQDIKNLYFILNTTNPWNLQTWFLFSYTHSQLYPHLVGNVASYLLALLAVFSFENNKRRFWIMAACSLLLVPVIASLLTIGMFTVLGVGVISQGFSAIGAAFIAYAMISIVLWIVGDMLEGFDHPEYFKSRLLFFVMCGLLTVVLALIIVGGIDLGLFLNAGESTSNGIAHFGGFITLLILFLLYDVRTEKRRYFQVTFCMAVGMGIVWYGNYLFTLIRQVKGI